MSSAIIPARLLASPVIRNLRRGSLSGRPAAIWLIVAWLASCSSPQLRAPDVTVVLIADSEQQDLQVAPGTTVSDVLSQAGITLGELDRVTPPLYSLVANGSSVRVIRVRESFEVEQVAIPFQRQIVRNEALPPEETRLIQAGEEGLQEITYRILAEDGVITSRTPLRTTLLKEPVPEILMIGASAPFQTVSIKGALAYIDGGNAWILTGDSGNRFPLVASAELDSRIFELSPDGQWLLFSRADETRLNALFVVATFGGEQPFGLPLFNVIHFADWSPSAKRTIAYSTVEPVGTVPGWRANNDLQLITFDEKKKPAEPKTLLPSNAEGSYSWWGTRFAWSPDGSRLAYARPDEIGWISSAGGARHPLLSIAPFRTQADWVWLPSIQFSPDGAFVFAVRHGDPVGQESREASPIFDLIAAPVDGGAPITLFERVGMFSEPAPGPMSDRTYEQGYNLAFLQAIRPLESDRSNYRLMVADRDGSNSTAVFPPDGEPGLAPGEVCLAQWSPDGTQIALIYQGNLWIVDRTSGSGIQLTGDGLVTRIDWR